MANKTLCAVQGCSKTAKSQRPNAMCPMHRKRLRQHGTTDTPPDRKYYRVHLPFVMESIQTQTDICIDWPGRKNHWGYGVFRIKRKSHFAHRYVCELVHGPSNGRCALHSCDNPGCINHRHLRWGTNAENVSDAVNRNRRPLGSQRKLAKISEQQARDIYVSSATLKDTADLYGVGITTVRSIKTRKKWRHATEGVLLPSSAPRTE